MAGQTEASADPVAAQAAHWIARLSDGDAHDREQARAGFESWKQRDPRHAAAAAGMEQFLQRLQGLRGDAGGDGGPARAALDALFGRTPSRKRSRRRGVTLLAPLLVVGAALVATLQAFPVDWLLADLRNSPGQWEARRLPDGTRVTLAGEAALNVRFDAHRRVVELVQGQLLVDVASDPSRPFVVQTPEGSMTALGTRFVVGREDGATRLAMIESTVEVRASARQQPVRVSAGEQVRISAAGISAPEPIDARSLEDAWRHRQLVVDDQPLSAVLEDLARHRRGRILFDVEDLADFRVTAVLPLDDTDRALQLLVNSFPQLQVRRLTPWLVWVRPGSAEKN